MIRVKRTLVTALLYFGAFVVVGTSASAAGTGRIQHEDGSVDVYPHVRISIGGESLRMTSADGKGTLIIGDAACEKLGELVHCLAYDGTLVQNGVVSHIPFASGAVWLNLTATAHAPRLSTELPPHGISLAVTTKAGTRITLTGTVDMIDK